MSGWIGHRDCCSQISQIGPPHLHAVLQASPHSVDPLDGELNIAMEGHCENLAVQEAGAHESVEESIGLVKQRGQEVQADLGTRWMGVIFSIR